ncbi:unnamed protein product [Cyprideis torosa]|uniref:Uncharacterized protein n=1 Tax=Cyprideis torosa TaxID=163714 RepID=A0A7R8ZL38_9CRUS|nr:unnamed protein product [Cyprideis torosa]CAG0882809.1 unnamed protein product [Cyprideis torosa]
MWNAGGDVGPGGVAPQWGNWNPKHYQGQQNVNWAALAQQWIAMKEQMDAKQEEVPATNEEGPQPPVLPPPPPPPPPPDEKGGRAMNHHGPQWTEGEQWGWGNGAAWSGGAAPYWDTTGGNMYNMPALPVDPFRSAGPTDGWGMGGGVNQAMAPVDVRGYKTYKEGDGSDMSEDDQEEIEINADKRRALPAWIREGLEKMERDKAKKAAKEREQKEREEIMRRKREEALRLNPTASKFDSDPEEDGGRVPSPVAPKSPEPRTTVVPSAQILKRKSRFDDPSKSVQPPKPTEIPPRRRRRELAEVDPDDVLTAEERREVFVAETRKILTELLLEITSTMMRELAEEVLNPPQPVVKPVLRQSSGSGGLGLTAYGSGDSSSESEEEEEEEKESGRKSADGGRRSADGGRRSADGGRRSADGGKRSVDGGRRSTDGGKRSADGGKRSADGGKSQRMEEGDPRMEEGDRQMEEGDRRMEERGRLMEEGDRRMEERGRRMEERGRRMEERGRRMEERGRRMEKGDRGKEEKRASSEGDSLVPEAAGEEAGEAGLEVAASAAAEASSSSGQQRRVEGQSDRRRGARGSRLPLRPLRGRRTGEKSDPREIPEEKEAQIAHPSSPEQEEVLTTIQVKIIRKQRIRISSRLIPERCRVFSGRVDQSLQCLPFSGKPWGDLSVYLDYVVVLVPDHSVLPPNGVRLSVVVSAGHSLSAVTPNEGRRTEGLACHQNSAASFPMEYPSSGLAWVREEVGADTGEVLDDSPEDDLNLAGKIRSLTVSVPPSSEVVLETGFLEPAGNGSEEQVLVPPSRRFKKIKSEDLNSRFVFDTFPVLPKKNIISAIVLSNWDNILGPKALQVWLPKPHISFGKAADEFLTVDTEESSDDEETSEASSKRMPVQVQIIGNDFLRVEEEFQTANSSNRNFSNSVPNNSSNPQAPLNLQKGRSLTSAIRYVVEHTLHAGNANSICQPPPPGDHGAGVTISFFVVPPEGVLALASTFKVVDSHASFNTGSPIYGGVPFSLSFVMDFKYLSEFYHLQSLLEARLKWLAAKVRVFLSKQPEDRFFHPVVDPLMIDLCEFLAALRARRLFPRRPLDGSLGAMAEKRFFERALTSHLQTGGCSIVIGKNEEQVNHLLSILSQFNSESDLFCSLSAVNGATDRRSFYPGAALQGFLSTPDSPSVAVSSLLASPRPVTLIDLNRNTVKQGPPFHQHLRLHLAYMRQQIAFINSIGESGTTHTGETLECVLHNVRDASTMAVALIKELLKLPPSKWEGLIDLFRKQLAHKAYALIRLADDELHNRRDQSIAGPPIPLRKHFREVLGSLDESDFLVVLAEAERLCPGIYDHVMTKKISLPSF